MHKLLLEFTIDFASLSIYNLVVGHFNIFASLAEFERNLQVYLLVTDI